MTVTTPRQLPGAARYVGNRVARVEDRRLLTGHGTYVGDIKLPGMWHGVFVRSPHARAKIVGIDTSTAATMPGVFAVFTAEDLLPLVHDQWHTLTGPAEAEAPRPPLCIDEVRFVGDPVVLVVAKDQYLAEDAADAVVVDYEPLDAAVNYATAPDAGVSVHADYPTNVMGGLEGGDEHAVKAAFAAAPHVVTATIEQHAYVPSPMETRGLVVDWDGEQITVYSATQTPHDYRSFCSRFLNIPEHRVRFIARDTGGAFGQKIFLQREEMCILVAAMNVTGPLKWIEDRRENLLSAGQSRHEHGDARMAFDDDGHLLAARLDFIQDVGAYPTPAPVGSGALTGQLFPGPYRCPVAAWTSKAVCSNTVGRSAYRGPWMFETLAREMMMDIAARQIGMDPAELRRRNLLALTDLPYANPNGITYDDVTPRETFEVALDILDYDGFRKRQAEARAEGRYLGVGISNYVELTTGGFGMYSTEGATIRIEPSGKVNVYMAGGSAGNSVETTAVQLAADALGVNIEDVNTIQGDTALTPYGAGTGGSRSGSMAAGAIAETAAILREKLTAIAAHRLEAAPEDIVLAEGRASVQGSPTIGISYAEMASMAYYNPAELPPGITAGLEASGRYTTPKMFLWANATHVCTCEVDVLTGEVTVLRYIVSEDCGPMINPNVVEGQIAGGSIQGIGGVLLEHLAYDADGNPLATTFMDYLLPTTTEVPIIEHGHVESPSGGMGGYKGVGEGGAIGSPAAVVNAVADAIAPFGVTITKLPLGPADIVKLITESGHDPAASLRPPPVRVRENR